MLSTPSPRSKSYLLLFRNTGPEVFSHLSAEQRRELMERWNRWYDSLAEAGKATEGQPLEAQTRIVGGTNGARVVDGPFPEAKEAIGGFVKLTVDSFEEATRIAQQHPALEHGMKIEVREMKDDCHLGVTAHQRPRERALIAEKHETTDAAPGHRQLPRGVPTS